MRKSNPLSGERFRFPLLTAGLLAAGILTSVQAQIQSAGTLLVDVDATGSTLGPMNSITNHGTLQGSFTAVGAGAVPNVTTVGGTKAMQFDGGDVLQLQDASGTPILAPPDITGGDPTCSIEVWALNPDLANEEALVSWGHRGGGDGTNMSFNYGSDFRWGAVGHWGNGDMGWNNLGGGPVANKWHHLVFTYDGSTQKIYADGAFQNGEYLGAGAINTYPDTYLLIGAQSDSSGAGIQPDLRFTGSIARVRVHNEVLTAAQVLNNYNFEKSAFVDPTTEIPAVQPARLTTAPIHRYTFNNAAGDASGAPIEDTIGDADGVVQGAGANFTGSRLTLPGGSSASAAYVDLPNGLLSSASTNNSGTGKFSIELFYKVTGSFSWSRIFDFGSSGVAGLETTELTGPGGAGEGLDFFMYSAQNGGDVNSHRVQVRNEDPLGGGNVNIDHTTSLFGRDAHAVITWDESTGRITAYENGVQVASGVTTAAMSDINDINNWLGRSNYGADGNAAIEFNDVRIYDYILSPGVALGNFMAGPDQFNNADFAPVFANNPVSASVPQGQNATFAVDVYGSSTLAVQWFRDNVAIANATNRTYTLTNVTINDNGAVFTAKASNTVNGTPTSVTSSGATLTVLPATDRLTAGPIHRWSFDNPAGDAVAGATIEDSVGDADAMVLGDGATFTGSHVTLPGGSSQTQAYIDLPNNLLSSHSVDNGGSGKFSIELWFKVTGTFNWARLFDFGSSGTIAGTEEVIGPGGGGEGRDYFMYSASVGTDPNNRRLEIRNDDPDGGGFNTIDNPTQSFNRDTHVVVTWDEATGRLTAYENGIQVSTMITDEKMSAINDVNVWLGRSNWTPDSNLQGEYQEVRIYDDVLTQRQVLGNFQAGYGVINTTDVAPVFTVNPQTTTILEGGDLTLTAEAQGSTPMALQWYRNGQPIAGAIGSTYTIRNITLSENGASYTARVSSTVNSTPTTVTSSAAVITVQPYTVEVKHRYSFDETSGTVVTDSVGGADGEVFGGATFGGGQLTLDGNDGYVNLPNGIISGLGADGTIEIWFTHASTPVWTRIFDFGVSTGGEDGGGDGLDFLFLAPRNGDGFPRFVANFPNGGDLVTLDPEPPGWIPGNEETHAVITWSSSKNISRLYLDGILVRTSTAPRPLSDMAGSDVNNWLGRSQFAADRYWGGSYNELRLISGAMTAQQVADSFAAGPGSGPSTGAPSLSVTQSGGNITIAWPSTATGFILQSAPNLNAGTTWTEVPGGTVNGSNMEVTVPTSGAMRFFRLVKP